MKLKIIYNLTFEKQRIKKTLTELEWYKKNKYELFFPSKSNPKLDSAQKIIKDVEKEYNKTVYKRNADTLQKLFNKTQKQFETIVQNIFGKKTPKTIKVYLTRYGVGGSYHLADTVILNTNYPDTLKILYHEIIHLLIEKDIQKHKVSHWAKKRIVDLILHSKHFASFQVGHYQDNYHGWAKHIDPLFKKHFFTDIQQFYKSIPKKI